MNIHDNPAGVDGRSDITPSHIPTQEISGASSPTLTRAERRIQILKDLFPLDSVDQRATEERIGESRYAAATIRSSYSYGSDAPEFIVSPRQLDRFHHDAMHLCRAMFYVSSTGEEKWADASRSQIHPPHANAFSGVPTELPCSLDEALGSFRAKEDLVWRRDRILECLGSNDAVLGMSFLGPVLISRAGKAAIELEHSFEIELQTNASDEGRHFSAGISFGVNADGITVYAHAIGGGTGKFRELPVPLRDLPKSPVQGLPDDIELDALLKSFVAQC